MRKNIISGLMGVAVITSTMAFAPLVHADTQDGSMEMFKASEHNLQQQITSLQHIESTNIHIMNQIASLQTQKMNIHSKITAIEMKAEAEAKAKAEAEAKARAEAEAKERAEQQAREKAEADARERERAEQLRQEAEAQAEAERVAQEQAQTQQAQQSQPTQAPPKQTSVASSGSLDMNQTSGTVDINALANWLATNKGTFGADKWAQIIRRESGGNVSAQNPSSGAYGVLQLYGHGEYPGMTLGQQLDMVMPLPASAWAETNY